MSVYDSVLSPVVAWRVLECLCVKPSGGLAGPGSDPVLNPVVAWRVLECLCVKPCPQWWLGRAVSVPVLSPVVAVLGLGSDPVVAVLCQCVILC